MTKISALPSATLPLTGAEIVPLDQGGVTKRTTVSALNLLNVNNFGAVGDGITDDTAAFTNALNALGSTGGTVYIDQTKKYLIDNNLTVPAGCFIVGGLRIVGNPSTGNAGAGAIWNYGSRLILNTTKTITLNGGAGIEGCFILRKGMTGPENDSSAYAGTVITAGGDDVLLRSCMVLGFGQLFTSTNFQRATIENVRGDCVNGFSVINALDVPRITNCHLWPFGTIAASAPVTTFGSGHYLHRNGTGYFIQTVGDQARLTNCFSYGHTHGFQIDNSNNVTLIGCHADDISQGGSPFVVAGTIGFFLSGTSNETVLIGCQVFAKENCFYQDFSAGSPTIQRATYIGCTARYFSNNAYVNVSGLATYSGCRLQGINNATGNGINIVATSGTSINDCNFHQVGGAIAGAGLANVVLGQTNHFINVGSTGAGGAVTQATSKATAVTLNTMTGNITTNNAALAAATIVSFTFNNATMAATDQITCSHESGGTTGAYTINARSTGVAGVAAVDIRNNTAGSLSEALVIRFSILKSVNA